MAVHANRHQHSNHFANDPRYGPGRSVAPGFGEPPILPHHSLLKAMKAGGVRDFAKMQAIVGEDQALILL